MHRLRATLVGACAAFLTIAAIGVLGPAAALAAAKRAHHAGPAARARIAVGPSEGVRVTRLGGVNLRALAARPRSVQIHAASPGATEFRLREKEGTSGAAPQAGLQPPKVPGAPVLVQELRRGFQGLSHREQAFASGVELEPPDQGLCGGKVAQTTFLFESVNIALALYDADSTQLMPAIDLSAFYGLPPAFDPATNKFGPFLSDPKCYFDPDTGHWFHTILEIGVDPVTGNLTDEAATLLAVSATGDPLGDYNIYSIDATDADHPHCPCFGDQPLLGADANGVYISTAEFSLEPLGAFANGAQIYALGKRALEAGTTAVPVHIATGTTLTATVQPATAPAGHYETARNGTEYFMSGFDCLPPDCRINPGLGNRITVWALTNTASLRTAHPDLSLSATTITSEVYGQPVPQVQRPGPRPLGESLGEPLPVVEANDTRMNQVVFANGHLWSGLNTVVTPGPRDGIAWFMVRPSVALPTVRASIASQGYVAARGAFVSFPSVGVNDAGQGVIAYSLIGPGFFPSSAYTLIGPSGTRGGVKVSRLGFRPEDGFTCYIEFFPPGTPPPAVCRWGDYSASFALLSGEIWSGAEFIGDGARTQFANWSTFVWPVSP
jgi:hypothetical protein